MIVDVIVLVVQIIVAYVLLMWLVEADIPHLAPDVQDRDDSQTTLDEFEARDDDE